MLIELQWPGQPSMKRASEAYNLELYRVLSLSNRDHGIKPRRGSLCLSCMNSSIAQATTL